MKILVTVKRVIDYNVQVREAANAPLILFFEDDVAILIIPLEFKF